MKKILRAICLCTLSLAELYATIKDDWAYDARLTVLLQNAEKLKHPFYRTIFDRLIEQTLEELMNIGQATPCDNSAKQLRYKTAFLESLLKQKIYYSCMTDTDMSDV